MKSSAPSLPLPAWKSLPGHDLRLRCDQAFGFEAVRRQLAGVRSTRTKGLLRPTGLTLELIDHSR